MKKIVCYLILTCTAFHCIDAKFYGKTGMTDLYERIYVQTDKQLYLAGEPVLMKFVTTNAEQIPLVFSKIAYAELVNNSVALIQIKVELNNGTGSGQMLLPSDLPSGYYRLIAYTQFMRNEGAEVFFEKNIAVMNTFQSGYHPVEDDSENKHEIADIETDDNQTEKTDTNEALITYLNEQQKNLDSLLQVLQQYSFDDELKMIGENFESTLARLKNIAMTNTFQSDYQKPAGVELKTGQVISTAEETDSYIISLQTDQLTYTIRERGELIITDLPENIHTLSVSITGKEWIPVKESNASLFRKNESKKNTEFTGKFPLEYEGHIITGRIIDNETGISPETNLEADKINVLPAIAFPGDEIRFFSGQINKTDKSIRFFTSGNSGTKEIATVMYNAGEKYRIDIQSPFVNRFEPVEMPVLRFDSSYYRQLLARSVALQVFRYFSEDRASETQYISQSYIKKKPSWTYRLDDYTRFSTMPDVFTELITNARFRRNSGKQELSVAIRRGSSYSYGFLPLVLLDGVPVSDHDLMYNYDPLLVERINIYDDSYVLGTFLFDGIIEFITYRRLHQNLSLNKSSQIISYESPQLPYRSDTPDYSKEKNRQSLIPDGRHTLVWNPDVHSGGQTSVCLPFDTSDLTGEFQATVEGITEDGEIIFATTYFKVE